MFKMREQKAFFEQKVWRYEKCSLILQRSKFLNNNKIVNKYDERS